VAAWIASPLCGAAVAAAITVLLNRKIFSNADPVPSRPSVVSCNQPIGLALLKIDPATWF
jgi:phosphate/sulfate permease